jgi:enterochelin esterase family protein
VSVAADELVLVLPDLERRYADVRFHTELLKRTTPPSYEYDAEAAAWILSLPRPAPVARVEYLLELVDGDGRSELVADPANPRRAPGPFGERSVYEFPDYAPPGWIDDDEAPEGQLRGIRLRARRLRAQVSGLLWSPHDTDPREPLPLLVAHDGPEYAQYSSLTRFLDSAAAEHELPRLRAALIAPVHGQRDEHYSASARYSNALARELLPQLERRAPTPGGRAARIGMGASLGALAMLHVHRMHPDSFGGLFLQSGSFFRQRSDRHESRFGRFGRITRFVGTVLRERSWPDPVPVAMMCGTGEENLANNEATRDALAAQGYWATLDDHPDAHNWVSWRDTFDPYLLQFLQRLWD